METQIDVVVKPNTTFQVAKDTSYGFAPNPMDLMAAWSEAFEIWAAKYPHNTQRAYRQAWTDLLNFIGKNPWEIGPADVQRWQADMAVRVWWKGKVKHTGLSECTRNQRIAGVSSFYNFVSSDYAITRADGSQDYLYHMNPAAGKSLRSNVKPYGKSIYLDSSAVKALIKAIPLNTVQGWRDFALILGYIMTARRNSEWRMVKWGDFEIKGERVDLIWSGKGKKNQRLQIAPVVWDAVRNWLRVSGRLETIQSDDFIFTALNKHASRLPNVSEVYDPSKQAISIHQANDLLKLYARLAGLNTEKLHIHVLRHSGAMLRRAAGDSLEEIRSYLSHSSLAVTDIYIRHMEGVEDKSWMKVADLLGLPLNMAMGSEKPNEKPSSDNRPYRR